MAKRFLPTQEWSTGGRGLLADFGIVAARCIVVIVAKPAAESSPFP